MKLGEEKKFGGVVVGVEYLEGFKDPLLYVYGELDGAEGDFYILVSSSELDEYMRLGIGQRIEGVGEVVSRDPLVLRKLEG